MHTNAKCPDGHWDYICAVAMTPEAPRVSASTVRERPDPQGLREEFLISRIAPPVRTAGVAQSPPLEASEGRDRPQQSVYLPQATCVSCRDATTLRSGNSYQAERRFGLRKVPEAC